MIKAYKDAKEYVDKNEIKTFNITISMLEIFESADLDEILELKGK